ncbi:MAG: YqaE/Pmp3 family membrane protein [Sphingomonadales bacterium]|nr:MAG: YqaE/Pmp3 family membrane protein [Sphingomonadales bacterium]
MPATPGHIVAAALLPPLGVYLHRGPGRDFLIACGLTVLAFAPGAAFALWTVLRSDAAGAAAAA